MHKSSKPVRRRDLSPEPGPRGPLLGGRQKGSRRGYSPVHYRSYGNIQGSPGLNVTSGWPVRGTSAYRLEVMAQNRGLGYTLAFVYLLINILAFTYGFMFENRQDYPDLRKYISPIGRGCGIVLDVNCAAVLLPTLKGLLTRLRQTRLAVLVNFDSNIIAHKQIAFLICFCTVLHAGGQAANYVMYYKLTPGTFGLRSVLITGCALTAILAAMLMTSLACVRRLRSFEAFYYTHHLYIAFYVLLFFHGVRHAHPTAVYYFMLPIVLYAAEMAARVILKAGPQTVNVVNASVRCRDIVHLDVEAPWPYRAGQYADVNVPYISQLQWHPFTISSSPLEDNLSFDIQALGDWTKLLLSAVEDGVIKDATVSLKGPFGAPAEHAYHFDHLIFIGTGIGATPFSSLLKDIALRHPDPGLKRRPKKDASGGVAAGANGADANDSKELWPDEEDVGLYSSCSSVAPRDEPVAGSVAFPFEWRSEEWIHSGQCSCSQILLVRMEELRGMAVTPFTKLAVKLQQRLRSVFVQLVLLWAFLFHVFLSAIVLLEKGDSFVSFSKADMHFHMDSYTMLVVLSEVLFALAATAIVVGMVLDVYVQGLRTYWSLACHRHEFMLVVPSLLVLSALDVLAAAGALPLSSSTTFFVEYFAKLLTVVPVVTRFRHIVAGLHMLSPQLYQHKSPDITRLQSVKFIWVNRHLDTARWLLQDLKQLEQKYGRNSLFDFHVYLTRQNKSNTVELSAKDRQSKHSCPLTGLRRPAKFGRPQWEKVLENLADGYPPGTVVGVFFCGSAAVAKVLQEACVACSSKNNGTRFYFKKENF